MIYILTKNKFILTSGAPEIVSETDKLAVELDRVPGGVSLFVCAEEKACSIGCEGNQFAISIDDLRKVIGNSNIARINLKLIRQSAPYSVWEGGELYVKAIPGKGYVVYSDFAMLRAETARLVVLCEDMDKRLKTAEATIKRLDDIFDDTYVTE